MAVMRLISNSRSGIKDMNAMESKKTGADIHAIGDAGLNGMSVPENLYQMAITAKGRRLTWKRMAGSRR